MELSKPRRSPGMVAFILKELLGLIGKLSGKEKVENVRNLDVTRNVVITDLVKLIVSVTVDVKWTLRFVVDVRGQNPFAVTVLQDVYIVYVPNPVYQA